MSVAKPSCCNQADIPQWAGTSVLQIRLMARIQNSSSKLLHPDNTFGGAKYLPSGTWSFNRFVSMDFLRDVHTLHVRRTWTFWAAGEAGATPAL